MFHRLGSLRPSLREDTKDKWWEARLQRRKDNDFNLRRELERVEAIEKLCEGLASANIKNAQVLVRDSKSVHSIVGHAIAERRQHRRGVVNEQVSVWIVAELAIKGKYAIESLLRIATRAQWRANHILNKGTESIGGGYNPMTNSASLKVKRCTT